MRKKLTTNNTINRRKFRDDFVKGKKRIDFI